MATIDHVSSTANAPDAVTSSTPAVSKRKRSTGDQNGTKAEGQKEQSQDTPHAGSASLHAFVIDLLDILQRHVPPFIPYHASSRSHLLLNYMLPPHADSDRTISSQYAPLPLLDTPLPSTTLDPHPAKRAKIATPATEATIATKIQESLYGSIDELVADLDIAASVRRQIKTASGLHNDNVPNGEAIKAVEAQLASLKGAVNQFVRREMVRNPQTFGQTKQATDDSVAKDGGIRAGLTSTGRMMLTLYGKGDSHYGPSRQLFSSLQKPVGNKATVDEAIDPILRSMSNDPVYSPLRETALPNGIFASKNVPTSINSKKPNVPTIGTLFPAPAHLPQLTPPRQSKHTTTRGQTVTFFDPRTATSTARPRGRTDHYTVQPLSTGQWIGYSANTLATKKRKRGQSFNELTSPVATETPAKRQESETEELFKSAYSSFAPDRDDSTALIPTKLKNRIWWDRYGARRFHSYLDSQRVDYSTGIDGVLAEDAIEEVHDEEDEELKKLVEEYIPAEQPPEFRTLNETDPENNGRVSEKDVDELLAEISIAIETLVSHQRARNLIPTSSTPAPPGLGSPSTPSTAELDVYNLLKNQLKVMISSLPPYAVAKLNGDQLEGLAITTRMPIEGDLGRGIMDDPEALSRARTTAVASATVPPARQTYPSRSVYTSTPTASSSRYTGTNSYSTPRTSLAASYPSQTYSGRDTATAQFNSYPPQHSSAAVRRPFTGGQSHHSSYTNGAPPRPNSYNSTHQYSSSTPQRASQPNYQHRPPNSTPSYSNYNATTTLSATSASYSNHNNHLGTSGNSASYNNYASTPRINSYHSHSHAPTSRPNYSTSTTATTSANNQAYSSNTYDGSAGTPQAPGAHHPTVGPPPGMETAVSLTVW